MKNIIDDIKTEELNAQKIIQQSQNIAKHDIEKAKIKISSEEEKELQNHQKVLEEYIQTAENVAKKETEEINKNKKIKIDKLNQINIEQGVDLIVQEIIK